jgi:hypothetical protein
VVDQWHQFTEQLLRRLGVVDYLDERSAVESIAPITAESNSLRRSGLAENWAKRVVLLRVAASGLPRILHP